MNSGGQRHLYFLIFFLVTLFGRYLVGATHENATLNKTEACRHQIYCKLGKHNILHVIQMAKLYNDSKTFVDKPLVNSPEFTIKEFDKLMNKSENHTPKRSALLNFVAHNFREEGSEFEDWNATDWKPQLKLYHRIKDEEYLKFAKNLNKRWKDLGRKVDLMVNQTPEQYSQLYLPNGFIVPGGRFRELYYWDSYWTILGLLQSEMLETVKGMLENFSYLISRHKKIPNGNRVYYMRRSQPPLFIPMCEKYYRETNDTEFLKSNIEAMENEFNFWIRNRVFSLKIGEQNFSLARYNVEVDGPRPESYYEDYKDAQAFSTDAEKTEFYINMKSGAESGWDYSSRWYNINGTGKITDTRTRHVAPVDLNAYLCQNARILSKFYFILNIGKKAAKFQAISDEFKKAIDKVFWNEEQGIWFDYDLEYRVQRTQFYPSALTPIWAECYMMNSKDGEKKLNKVMDYLENSKVTSYPGGIPTSLRYSRQQWDLFNAWPPLQEIVITSLAESGNERAKNMALELAQKWVRNVWISYQNSNQSMFEKYNVEKVGHSGTGGEYSVQEGFGWTNGVILDLFHRYGNKLSHIDDKNRSISRLREKFSIKDPNNMNNTANLGPVASGATPLILLLVAYFFGYY